MFWSVLRLLDLGLGDAVIVAATGRGNLCPEALRERAYGDSDVALNCGVSRGDRIRGGGGGGSIGTSSGCCCFCSTSSPGPAASKSTTSRLGKPRGLDSSHEQRREVNCNTNNTSMMMLLLVLTCVYGSKESAGEARRCFGASSACWISGSAMR
ncbi:hypothetical protein DIPPA_20402 [Diplonema papillatum]|nr:hypothetical protein DIPPA_20402 [Diplonema papillatum]